MKKWLAFALLLLPLQAGAEVMNYTQCKMIAGKAFSEIEQWQKDWRALATKNKIDYRLRLLVPHADGVIGLDEFFIEGATPSLTSHAKAWEWWYGNAETQALNARLTGLATCKSTTIYMTSDVVAPR
jgi:hypothetical protein